MTAKWTKVWLFALLVMNFLLLSPLLLNANEVVGERSEPETQQRVEKKSKKTAKFKFDQNFFEVTIRDDVEVGSTIIVASASFKKKKSRKCFFYYHFY